MRTMWVMVSSKEARARFKVCRSARLICSERISLTSLAIYKRSSLRPAFLTMVSLQVPRVMHVDHLALLDSVTGQKLEEGGAPIPFQVTYDGLEVYRRGWNKIRAVAQDSAGNRYYSPYTKKKPSWAN